MIVRILSIFLILLGCKSKQVIDPNIPETKVSDSIWSIRTGLSITPHLTKDRDIIYTEKFSADPRGESVIRVSGVDGKRMFEWNNYLHSPVTISDQNVLFKDEKMIFSNGPRNYCINTKTGESIWRTQLLNYAASGSLYFDGKETYYQSMSKSDFRVDIIKANTETGDREILISIIDSARIYHYLEVDPMVIATNSLNENILLISVGYLSNFDGNEANQKIFCYNLVNKKYDWIVDYEGEIIEFQSNIYKTISNRTYLAGHNENGRYLVCLNNNDGNIIWQQLLPDLCTSLHLYQGQIIPLCNGKKSVISYNQLTGSPNWVQSFISKEYSHLNFAFNDAIIFKNYLISTQCDYLLALNLNTGQVVCHEKMSFGSGCLQNGIAIDEQKRCFYVMDRQRLICYKLPESISY